MIRILLLIIPFFTYAQADSLFQLLNEKEKTNETVDWLTAEAAKIQKTSPKEAELLSRKALDIATDLNYSEGIAKSYFSLGLSFWYRDLYDQAMENYLEALRIFEDLGMESDAARAKMNIGNTYDELGQTEIAKKYIKESLETFERLGDSTKVISGYLNLGVIYFYQELYDSALFNFRTVLAHHKARQDTSSMALIYLNLANVYEYMDNLPDAIINYRMAKALIDPTDLLAINIDMGLGNALLLNGQDEGVDLITSGLEKSKKSDQHKMEQFAYEALKDHYESKGNFEKAFDFQKKEIEIDRKWRGKEVQEQIEVLQLKYEDEKKAKQVSLLEAEQEENRLQLTIAIIVGAFVLFGAIMMFMIFKLRIKNSKLREEELRQKIEHKNKELASYALNFIQKNELLNDLSEKVAELKKDSSEKTARGLNQLSVNIRSHMKIDQDWENFKIMFEEVHEGFLFRLKESFPDLGNAELKLCALLRLNLNLKESSQILGISSDSVKTARSRLRKKLGLSTDENLVDFVIMFDHRRRNTPSVV